MTRSAHRLGLVALIATVVGCSATNNSLPTPAATPTVAPFAFTRAAGTFYAQGTGPTRPALDCIASNGAISASSGTITLSAAMNGPIVVGAPNYYVWGINRGAAATPGNFPGEPNVIFDAVVVETVNADGTFSGTLTTLGTGGSSTPLPTSAMTIASNVITVAFASSLLPTTGFTATKYTWNLWPRSGVGGSATAQIASFCPENAMFPMVVLP